MNPLRVAVIGAGAWGTALADFLSDIGHQTVLWIYEEDLCSRMQETHVNDLYLPDFNLHKDLEFTSDLVEASSSGQDVILSAMPSHVVANIWDNLSTTIHEESTIVSVTKGFDPISFLLPSQIIENSLKDSCDSVNKIVSLSGPTFALELVKRNPTAITAASFDLESGVKIQKEFSSSSFRIYYSNDPIGVQVGGALKNVIALAAGIVDGLEVGLNARAALIVRGLKEISRLALEMGGDPQTLSGLSGMGDLILTCTGELSRNRTVGYRIGKGEKLSNILDSMISVAEGVATAPIALSLSKKFAVEMPICEEINAVLFEEKDPLESLNELMKRPFKEERT
ncbi:MAG: glycerol-3-phosphate dehydrogenase [Nitrospinae bacterium]|nr:glycerol-3-phosphate dehydrogenase [Nitrospinota bacterium]